MENLVYLIVGLAVVVWGTKLSLDNAMKIAARYELSDFFIGVAILAIGTDLPEIVVSVNAAIRQLGTGLNTSNLIVGNAIGSCFGQLGLVMGTVGLFIYLTMSKRYMLHHGAVLLSSMLLLFVTGLDGTVSRIEGTVLVLAFAAYLMLLFGEEHALEKARNGQGPVARVWLLLGVGLLLVVGSSEVIVRSAIALAEQWEVDQSVIAIVIIGVGTSLPELVVSAGAALHRRGGMSVGNLVGSNILDVLLPIGLAGIIAPVAFDQDLLYFDLPALFLLTLLVVGSFLRVRGLQRMEAIILVAFYVLYILVKLVTS